MKIFLKVLLILIAVVVAVKLLPFAVAFGFAVAGCALILGLLGATLAAGLVGAGLVLLVVLSPIWLPLLAIVGIIALIKKLNEKPVTA